MVDQLATDAGRGAESSSLTKDGGRLFKSTHQTLGHAPISVADYVAVFAPNLTNGGWHRGDGAHSIHGSGWSIFCCNDFWVSDGAGGTQVFFRRNSALMVDTATGVVSWLSSGDQFPIPGSVTFPSPSSTVWSWLKGGWPLDSTSCVFMAGHYQAASVAYTLLSIHVMKAGLLTSANPWCSKTVQTDIDVSTDIGWQGQPWSDGSHVYVYGFDFGNVAHHLVRHAVSSDIDAYATGWEYWTGSGWSTDIADAGPLEINAPPLRSLSITQQSTATMTVQYLGAGATSEGDNASLTPALPAPANGLQRGDLLVVLANIRNHAATVNTPTGWTRLAPTAASSFVALGRYWEPGLTAPTITFTGGATGDTTQAKMLAFHGCDQNIATVVHNQAGQTNAAAQNVNVPGLAVTTNGCAVIAAGAKATTWTSAAQLTGQGLTEVEDRSSAVGNGAAWCIDYKIETTAANFVTTFFTITGGIAAVSRSLVLALRPHTPTAWGYLMASSKYFDAVPDIGATEDNYTQIMAWTAPAVTGPWSYSGVLYPDTGLTDWFSYTGRIESLPGMLTTAAIWSLNRISGDPDIYGPHLADAVQLAVLTGADTGRGADARAGLSAAVVARELPRLIETGLRRRGSHHGRAHGEHDPAGDDGATAAPVGSGDSSVTTAGADDGTAAAAGRGATSATPAGSDDGGQAPAGRGTSGTGRAGGSRGSAGASGASGSASATLGTSGSATGSHST